MSKKKMKQLTFSAATMARLVVTLLCSTVALHAMNIVRPYQILLRPEMQPNSWMQIYAYGEGGFASHGFNDCGDRVDALRIYQPSQDALAMLNGFDPASAIGQKRIRVDANDDGVRGHLAPCSKFEVPFAAQIGLRWFFNHNLSLAFYMPYYHMRLRDVRWQDLTQDITVQDARTKQYLTNDIVTNVAELGGLSICGWDRKGVGDTTVSLEWIKNFKQHKRMLHMVGINGRLGLTLPSGLRSNEDEVFAFAFGNDGAFGIVFALGLDLYAGKYVKAGVDVQLMHQFGNTRERRIKTAPFQTDLLLLAKTSAFTDFGLTQQFSLYFELYKLYAGVSLMVAYQFYKHGFNTLYLTCNQYSTEIANTACDLQGFTTHDAFVVLKYDAAEHMCNKSWSPYVAAFVDIPFNGKRAITTSMAGLVLGLNF
jgi:hypothetical protein